MATVMYLQPVDTSTSSFSSTATIRRHGLLQRSNDSLWSSFLTDSLTTAQKRRLSSSYRPVVSKDESSTTLENTSPKESFKSAYSRQLASISNSNNDIVNETGEDVGVHHEAEEAISERRAAAQTQPDKELITTEHNSEEPAEKYECAFEETDEDAPEADQSKPFRRWLSTLRRRKQKPAPAVTPCKFRRPLDDFDAIEPTASCFPARRSHEKSPSWTSSSGLIATMRSATVTLASASIAPLSRHTSRRRYRQIQGSTVSCSDARQSIDSQRQILDQAARQRSRKRRDKVEELIRSEESYVADIKALCNAYFTLLGHQQSFASFARTTAQNTMSSMHHLHDDLLGQLQRVVPFAEFDQSTAKASKVGHTRPHTRWHSVDGIPNHMLPRQPELPVRRGRRSLSISKSPEHEAVVLHCPPHVVGAVAAAFCAYLPRFAIYDAFGAKYEMIKQDVVQTQGLVSSWPDFDRAIEALSTTLNPMKSREANKRKALTIKDLLIKPIQRLPRYELLFAELSRLTPVCDDPIAHALIEDVRGQLSEACRSMNSAKENPIYMRTLETTWLLSERLTFSKQVPKTIFLHLLGEVLLCGCLHVTYRSKGEFMKGSYMVCIMFSTTIVLASIAHDDSSKYSVLAGISLATTVIEETDNGKGLQCHTTPHTEAKIWRSHLGQGIASQGKAVGEHASNVVHFHSPLTAEMKSIGATFGKPGSFVRRMSVHRSATVGPTTDLNQVMIKNTQAVKETMTASNTTLQLPRSQSTASPSHVQTLAPRRVDRIRLESLLVDVWSPALPYPGMTVRRTDQLKGSADQIMRKLSIASLANSFHSTKRNGSHTSMTRLHKDSESSKATSRSKYSTLENKKPARLPLSELLPADFELQNGSQNKRKNALRAITMTMERPFSPLLGNGESSLKRAQSVRDRHDAVGITTIGLNTPIGEGRTRPATTELNMNNPREPAVCEDTRPLSSMQTTGYTQTAIADSSPKKAKGKGRLRRLFG